MKHKDDKIRLRELHRKFTKTNAELAPILVNLKNHRLIVWDPKNNTVSINSYDPKNRQRFQWLAESSWPRSPFEPYLQKGAIYEVRDFREYVVEEWVRTGAAVFI